MRRKAIQIGWFIGIWAVSIIALGLVSLAIKAMIGA